jgi:hypothetical protein
LHADSCTEASGTRRSIDRNTSYLKPHKGPDRCALRSPRMQSLSSSKSKFLVHSDIGACRVEPAFTLETDVWNPRAPGTARAGSTPPYESIELRPCAGDRRRMSDHYRFVDTRRDEGGPPPAF